MAKKIRISGEIGFGVPAAAFLESLDAAGGEDLDIEIASPGGDVFSGLEMFNGLAEYRRLYPRAKITIRISGLAASMASYIASFPGAKVTAEANAVYMVHNPWNGAVGDYREMQKNAEFLKGLTDLLAKAYQARTKKTAREMESLMSAETWLFGSELKDAGFVDEMLPGAAAPEEKPAAISRAKLACAKVRSDLRGMETDPERVAAMMRSVTEVSDPAGEAAENELEAQLITRAREGNLRSAVAPKKEEPWRPCMVDYSGEDVDPGMEEQMSDVLRRAPAAIPAPSDPIAAAEPAPAAAPAKAVADEWRPGEVDEI